MKKKYGYIFVLFLFSCETIVDLKIQEHHPMLNVVSSFTPDSLWFAYVSLSHNVLELEDYTVVDNAIVSIFQNEQPIDTLQPIGNGKYRSVNKRPVEGQQYNIRVVAPKYEPAEATSSIPEKVIIEDVQNTKIDKEDFNEYVFNIRFKDIERKSNYYFLQVVEYLEYVDIHNVKVQSSRLVDFKVEAWYEASTNSNRLYFYFTDAFFEDDVANIRIRFFGNGGAKKYTVSLKNLNKDLYEYWVGSILQYDNSDNIFSQPIVVHSNIKGGFGIFGGFNQSTYDVIVE